MTSELLSALTKDVLHLLKKEQGFFGLSEDQRRQKAPALSQYLGKMSQEDFVQDLELTLKALRGGAKLADSRMAQALAGYFLKDFPAVFDQLDRRFYALSEKEQQAKLQELLPEKAVFFSSLRYLLQVLSVQEVTENIVNLLTELFDSPRIVVQSPVECDRETKQQVRAYFADQHPQSFVAFSVNAQLIGGIRFFVNGKVQDLSWFSKIQHIKQLSQLVS